MSAIDNALAYIRNTDRLKSASERRNRIERKEAAERAAAVRRERMLEDNNK